DRAWARGVDLDDPLEVEPLMAEVHRAANAQWTAGPIVGGKVMDDGEVQQVTRPADRRQVVGVVRNASQDHVDAAFSQAVAAQPRWDALGGPARGEILERAADLMEQDMARLMGLIGAEAGRTVNDAVAEVREAVDFLRYYALQARERFVPQPLPGPTGETNRLSLHGRGVFA